MEENNLASNRSTNASLNPYAVGGGGNANTNKSVQYQTGNAEVDNLTNTSNQLLQNSLNAQQQAIQTGVQTNVNELNRQKDLAQQENTKLNKGLYQNYMKQMNPYGGKTEVMAAQGLGHSGMSETTKSNIYNTYQKNITESLNNLSNVKANYDAQIAQVRSQGDIAQAQNLSNMYLQQIEQIRNAYTMAQAQKEFEWQKSVNERDFNYQLGRDTIADKRYDTEWAYQKDRDALSDRRYDNEWKYKQSRDSLTDQRYADELAYQRARDAITDQRYADELAYQKERDRIADSQWQQQFNAAHSSSGSGGSSRRSSRSSSRSNNTTDEDLVNYIVSNPFSRLTNAVYNGIDNISKGFNF